MSRNNTLQNELLISGVTIDEAMAADIATLNVEGRHMGIFYYISFNFGLHRGRRGEQAHYTSRTTKPVLVAEDQRAS